MLRFRDPLGFSVMVVLLVILVLVACQVVCFIGGAAGLGVPPASRCQDHGRYPGNSQTVFPEGSIFGVVSASVWVDDPVYNQGRILPSIFSWYINWAFLVVEEVAERCRAYGSAVC